MKNKKIILLILILLIFITIILGVYFVFFYQNKTNITNTTNPSNVFNPNISIDKPIIYIYPEETTSLLISLGYPEKITCSYPTYSEKWNVTAYPDGTLIDNTTNRELYALYWEGENFNASVADEGFIVNKNETVKFLEEKLDILGLSNKEAEEFIIYWLPKLQESEYNYIRFTSQEELNSYMPLEFSKEPDTLIRIHMQFKHLDEPIKVKEQILNKKERSGFTVVEWGGTEIK